MKQDNLFEISRIPMSEDALIYLQMLIFELDGYRALNCQIIKSGGATKEQYADLLEKYKTANATYQTAFIEAVKATAPEYSSAKYHHAIDFFTEELVVSTREVL